MDRNFYDNDFEEFLKQKSDQYKMYPSDRVWNNVYSSIHGRKKWWALGFTLFFITTGLLIGRQLLLSNYNKVATQLNKGTETIVVAKMPAASTLSAATPQNNRITPAGAAHLPPVSIAKETTATTPPNNSGTKDLLLSSLVPEKGVLATETPVNTETAPVIENNLVPSYPSVVHGNEGAATSTSIPQKKPALHNTVVSKAPDAVEDKDSKPINQLEQKVVAGSIKYSNWSLQLYASPTISYRRLTTLNPKGDSYIPVAATNSGNINNYVHHLPATGFELGSNVQYKLSNSLSIFAGAQLNYSRYYIDAFKYRTEKASIALNNDQLHDTLSGYTNIRNFSGYAPEQLQNKYLQLSLPVGIEIKLLGNKKLQFNIAGGVQPTFLLTSNSYLISSDYKNYIQSPDLVRGFNVHTNFEAFISYKTGGLKWQVGPQFRSQLLSSYTNQYRVREYLTEYGIKFGVSRSF